MIHKLLANNLHNSNFNKYKAKIPPHMQSLYACEELECNLNCKTDKL